jgi:hypothetical protein
VNEDFEGQLKNALARKDAPDWFEAKVLAAAAREPSEQRSFFHQLFTGGRLRWATVAAVIAISVSGVTWQHERSVEERAAGEAAKARLELALKITSTKLHKIERTLNEVERDRN